MARLLLSLVACAASTDMFMPKVEAPVDAILHRLALGKFHDDLLTENVQGINITGIKPVVDFVFGVTSGMLSDQGHLPTCITNAVVTGRGALTALLDAKNAIVDKDISELADALDDVADMLRTIPDMLSVCGATKDDYSDVVAALKEIDSFKDFLKKAEKHAVLNSKSILGDVAAAREAWAALQYEESGERIGNALHKIAFGKFHDDLFTENVQGINITGIKPVVEFIFDVTSGMLSDQGHLPTCITNAVVTGRGALTALLDAKNAIVDK